jgi:malonate transporter and related proteins
MIFAVIIPIFLLLFFGYLSVKLDILTKEHVAYLGAFVIKVALPALFLQSLASKKLQDIWYFEYFAVYSAATLFLYVLAYFCMRSWFSNTPAHSSVLSLGAAMSNTGLIGTAVLSLLLGQKALTYTSLVVIIESVILIPLVLILAALGAQQQAKLSKIVQDTFLMLFKNPLFMGVMIGIILATCQIKIPTYLDQVLSLLGQTASPLALFAIGGGIVGMSLKYVNVQSWYLVISSNLLMPALVYLGLSELSNVSQEMVYAGTIIAALPMPTIFGMLGQAYGINERALTPLLMSTILGFIVVSILITVWWA